jgi:hypothetical protein
VTYCTTEAASAAIASLHGKVALPGAKNPLQVKQAQKDTGPVNKLFVARIAKSADAEVRLEEVRDSSLSNVWPAALLVVHEALRGGQHTTTSTSRYLATAYPPADNFPILVSYFLILERFWRFTFSAMRPELARAVDL